MVMRGVNGLLETACGRGATRAAVSRQAQDEVRRYYRRASARVVHNGVEFDHFRAKVDRSAARRRWSLPDDRFLVLVVGRMDYGKGRNILREMLPLLPPEALAVIAAPSWSGLDTLPSERYIHIPGAPYAELPALYQACDAHLSPSLYEGFGLTAIEAWASGIPVVSGRLGLLRELEGLEASLDACLADVGDPRGLAAAVERLVRDPELGKKQAEWGSALVEERFTIERVTTEYQELIQQALDQGKRASSLGSGSL
jgi:glycosyltransferase involved in cell wall biosynthesis